mmetsp:Transcript_28507/g.69513  ORF Transcript_28507/g.69513 Transcript_28507/m.69513 type:complete len:111 (+) Transcript_28507:1024-1356(+)
MLNLPRKRELSPKQDFLQPPKSRKQKPPRGLQLRRHKAQIIRIANHSNLSHQEILLVVKEGPINLLHSRFRKFHKSRKYQRQPRNKGYTGSKHSSPTSHQVLLKIHRWLR